MDIVLKIMIAGLSIFEVHLCYQFLFLCWADKKELSRGSKIVLAVVCIVIGGVVGIGRSYPFFSQSIFLGEAIVVMFSLIVIPMKKKMDGMEIVGIFFSIVALIDFLFAFAFLEILGESFGGEIFWGISHYKIIIFICTRGLLLLLLYKMRGKEEVLKETIYECRKGLLLFCVSSVVILRVYQIIFVEYLGEGTSMRTTEAIVSLVTIFMLSILGIGLLVKNLEVKKELDFVLVKDTMLNEHYQQVAILLEESREHIHDMKHHLQILDDYTQKGENEKIHGYLQEIGLPVLSLGKMAWTDSEILNLVLNQKRADAEKKNISMDVVIDPRCHLPLTDCEICSLFSNLLENSIESCIKVNADKRWIKIEMDNQGEMTFIYITNTVDEPPQIIDEEIQSRKEEKGIHGLGLRSVKRIVNKYNGEIKFEVKAKKFGVYITFFGL